MKAVVTRELNQYAVEDVTLDPPKAGELRIKMGATGVCHSDLSVINGTLRWAAMVLATARASSPDPGQASGPRSASWYLVRALRRVLVQAGARSSARRQPRANARRHRAHTTSGADLGRCSSSAAWRSR
jgi:hypothetical protein